MSARRQLHHDATHIGVALSLPSCGILSKLLQQAGNPPNIGI